MVERLTTEWIGSAIGLVLLVLATLVLPAASRRLTRAPAVFLALHLVTRAIGLALAPGSSEEHGASLVGIILLFISIGRSGLLIAVDAIIGPRLARPIPRIFRDILQGVVYVVLLFVAMTRAGVEPGSLLTTSALLTAAIALSLQETLGNLVAGLALQAQRPFDVDDWIQFDTDPKHIGRVLEVNWRATKVLTLDDVEVIVPNAVLAKAPIANFTKPTAASRRSLYISVPAEVPPHDVRAAVLEALPGAFGVLDAPPPSVVLNAFVDGNIEYWIRFHTTGFHLRDGIDSGARERVWYAFARRGIAIAAPNRAVMLREITHETEAKHDASQVAHRGAILAKVDFLGMLTEPQRAQLAAASKLHAYGQGEIVVRQGDSSAEMFIVQTGQVIVQHEQDGQTTDVASLGPGQFFGEMALMTGEQRMATVRAGKPSTLISIDRDAMHALLELAPELAAVLSRAITERRETASASRTTTPAPPAVLEERSSQLLDRVRKFFSL